jgi:nitroreductase
MHHHLRTPLALGLRSIVRCFSSSASSPALSSAAAAAGAAAPALHPADLPPAAQALHRLLHARRSDAAIDAARAVDARTLRALVELTARAPSGFNMQPYTVVLLQDPRARARLAAEAMRGGGNAARVARAPLVAVFAADLNALASVGEVQDLEARGGQRSPAYLRGLPTSAAAFASAQGGGSGGGSSGSSGSCSSGGSAAAAAVMAAAGSALGALTGVPLPPLGVPGIAWAYKQAGLAAMTYLLAAASLGLAAHPMEGLDPARAARAVGLCGTRFSVPLVVATGWPAAGEGGSGGGAARAPTPRRMSVFRLDRASTPFPL